MSRSNTDLIAASFAYPEDLKSPYGMGPPRVSSVQTPKPPGKCRRLEKHCNSGPKGIIFFILIHDY